MLFRSPDHLEHIGFETGLFGKLQTFFEKKLLFWLEVLSLTNNVGFASVACAALNAWLAAGQGVSIFVDLMRRGITNAYDLRFLRFLRWN